MSKQVTTQALKLFIGMDVHKKTWKVNFTTDLTIDNGHSMPPDPEGIKKYVKRYYTDHETSIAYESGCCGYVAARKFESYGWDTYVINLADTPRPSKNAITNNKLL